MEDAKNRSCFGAKRRVHCLQLLIRNGGRRRAACDDDDKGEIVLFRYCAALRKCPKFVYKLRTVA